MEKGWEITVGNSVSTLRFSIWEIINILPTHIYELWSVSALAGRHNQMSLKYAELFCHLFVLLRSLTCFEAKCSRCINSQNFSFFLILSPNTSLIWRWIFNFSTTNLPVAWPHFFILRYFKYLKKLKILFRPTTHHTCAKTEVLRGLVPCPR